MQHIREGTLPKESRQNTALEASVSDNTQQDIAPVCISIYFWFQIKISMETEHPW